VLKVPDDFDDRDRDADDEGGPDAMRWAAVGTEQEIDVRQRAERAEHERGAAGGVVERGPARRAADEPAGGDAGDYMAEGRRHRDSSMERAQKLRVTAAPRVAKSSIFGIVRRKSPRLVKYCYIVR
jgi:hypothetical protein